MPEKLLTGEIIIFNFDIISFSSLDEKRNWVFIQIQLRGARMELEVGRSSMEKSRFIGQLFSG